MADDTLRLVARVIDEFTGPFGKLKGELKGVGDESRRQAGGWKKDWDDLRTGAEKYRGVLGDFSPVLAKIGVGGMGAALSLGGVAVALEKFAGSTRNLSLMAKDIGLTVDQLRAFGGLGEKFGFTADTMRGAAKNFADEMKNIQQHGTDYVQLQAMNLSKLAEDLASSKNMEQAIERGLEGLKNIPDPVVRRRVARMLFGTDDIAMIASNLTGTARAALQEVQSQIGSIDKATEEAAKRFEGNLDRVGKAFEKLKVKTLSPILGGAATVMEGAAEALETDPNDPRSRLSYLKKERQDLDERIGQTPEGSFKRRYYENNRAGIDEQILRIERPSEVKARSLETELKDRQERRDWNDKNVDHSDPGLAPRQKELADEIHRLTEEIRRLRANGDGAATVQQQSFNPGGPLSGSLIQKAAWGGSGFGGAGIYGGPGGGVPGSSSAGGGYGGAGGGGTDGSGASASPRAPVPHRDQIDRGVDIGEGIRGVPFGSKGRGAAIPSSDQGANPSAYKDVLDHIADSEGTINRPKASGYNTSLGYGKFLPGGQEQNLTGMTLDQISALGRYMRRQPGNPNSSALGRYQIVGDTMRRLMKRMGLKGDELFDEKMQDRMGAELARDTHGNPARLRREWASLVGERNRRAAELMGKVDPSASTMPGDRPSASASGPLSAPSGPLSSPKSEVSGDGAPAPNDDGRGVNADLIKVLKRAQQISKVPFHIHEGMRTLERQREMVARGWSKTMDSEHIKGRAVDVRADGDPAVGSLDRRKYEEISRAMRAASREAGVPVEWGGDWKGFKDVPHFQFPKGYRSGADAYAGDPAPGRPRAEDGPAGRPQAGEVGGKGTLHIKFENAPAGMRAKHDMDGLFRETTVSHGRSQMDMDRA